MVMKISSNKTNKLPQIPNKRYFTIGEVGHLCGVKPHVLRYWEQEFPQLRPSKRRGNRRYYLREDVLMVREIRQLLYDEGYTISGARTQLDHNIHKAKSQQNPTHRESDHTVTESEYLLYAAKEDETAISNDEDLSSHTSFISHNASTKTHSIDFTAQQSGTYVAQQTQDNQGYKLKQYKITISEAVIELKEILSLMESSKVLEEA